MSYKGKFSVFLFLFVDFPTILSAASMICFDIKHSVGTEDQTICVLNQHHKLQN